MYSKYSKSIFDFVFSIFGILILLPVILIIAVVLFLSYKESPFFFQQRTGKNGKVFKIIKFKTMNDKKNKEGKLLSDSLRLTKLGSFIRKTSLDEIPQLFNVLKGDMSIIGPRPLLPGYYHLYTDFQNRRHEIKPGITGWAQVNGRNAISWDKKFEYDVWYVDHISFTLDFKIIMKTVLKVLKKEGITITDNEKIEPYKVE